MKRQFSIFFLFGFLLIACPPKGGDTGDSSNHETASDIDMDGDGYPASEDCDDIENDSFPGNPEVCDGIDNDCDGTTDENEAEDAQIWFRDADSDGYGNPESSMYSCYEPDRGSDGVAVFVADATDCDDYDGLVNPGAAEICDGIDNDCDTMIDSADVDIVGESTWYADYDGDEYGDADSPLVDCSSPTYHVSDSTDCDDTDPAVNPSAIEVCDGFDNDCDVLVDDADSGVTDQATWYRDNDNDGYGMSDDTDLSCNQPAGYAGNKGDCDDSDERFYPDAEESDCTDPNDYNCDGYVTYQDVDGDNFAACVDCNDANDSINPDAPEVCDDIDNDCDDLVDDEDEDVADQTIWYKDNDNDEFGTPKDKLESCESPEGYSENPDDCFDYDEDVNPDAPEVCDDIDNDCDGTVDERCPPPVDW